MSFEEVGAAATAGLAAGAIERRSGHAGEAHTHCADCGAELVGRFCHQCGQPAHIHRTLLHLFEELLHGVMHFDGRIWRTLPLLVFRPGRLTREWIHGRRSRYVSPLAMFLFTAFLTFMILSFLPKDKTEVSLEQGLAQATAQANKAQGRIVGLEKALASASGEDAADLRREIDEARRDLREARAEAGQLADLGGVKIAAGPGLQYVVKSQAKFSINTGWPWFDEKVEHAVANPELAWYKFKNSFYKFSFLLVPLSIPFVALLFLWKRGFTLYDHGVFILYSLTFVSLAFLVSVLAGKVQEDFGDVTGLVLTTAIPAHMYYQLQGAYGLRTFSTIWRLLVLLVFCLMVTILFVLAVLALGL